MRKLLIASVLAATAAIAPVSANAAAVLDYTPNVGGTFVNTSVVTTQGAQFEDTIQFITTADFDGTFSFTTTGSKATSGASYLNFTTATINGTDIPITVDVGTRTVVRTGKLLDFRLPAGLQTLIFRGNAGTAARYDGNFTLLAAVPEPATWAMMIAGFGMVGVGMRRRKVAKASVAFA